MYSILGQQLSFKRKNNLVFRGGGLGGGGDELANRSYRDRAADYPGHRDVTRNLSLEL